MLVLSIDPGLVNIGVCLMDTNEKQILYADKVHICTRMKDLMTESEIIPRVYECFFTGKIGKMLDLADIVLIEQQMKRKFLLIQYTIGAICFEKHKAYEFVSPKRIKTFFHSGKQSRKQNGKNVKGKFNNHAENKKTAVAIATYYYPQFMLRVNSKKRDDVADAILQARWYAMRKNS
jgi:Holliday junction resolvasome RuvABC endonuclease subunit